LEDFNENETHRRVACSVFSSENMVRSFAYVGFPLVIRSLWLAVLRELENIGFICTYEKCLSCNLATHHVHLGKPLVVVSAP
jgi:hypothetical protein